MNIRSIIANQVQLFKWKRHSDEPKNVMWLEGIGIVSIVGNKEVVITCPYCDVQIERAVVTFYGPLRPVMSNVSNLSEGDVIDVVCIPEGRRDNHENGENMFRLFARQVIGRSVPQILSAIYPADDGLVVMHVEVECDVQLLRPEVEEV